MSDHPIQLVIGLGNPGPEYANTRHNVGYQVIDIVAQRLGVQLRKHASRTLTAEGRLGVLPGGAPGPKITLAKAQTFMNVSGGPLGRLAEFLKIPPEGILVVHDDLDLEEYLLRLKRGGGEGGHNGLKSLTAHLHSRDYARLRMGIGRPPGRQHPADYVLAQMTGTTKTEWDVIYQLAADAVEATVVDGFMKAQQALHGPSSN